MEAWHHMASPVPGTLFFLFIPIKEHLKRR